MDWKEREKQELKLDEGLRLKAYWDNIGKVWTNGYGNTKNVFPNTTISIQEAEEDLDGNFEDAYSAAVRFCPVFNELSGPRKGVLVNMAFNLGESRLDQFNGLRSALCDLDFDRAALHMMNSLWAKQVKDRAKRLAMRMKTNEYAKR